MEGGVEVKGRGSVGWKRQKRESGRSGELEREGRGGEGERPEDRKYGWK